MYSGVKCIFNKGRKVKGTVVLMRKNVLDVNTITSVRKLIGNGINIIGATVDGLTAFLGRSVALRLISATAADSNGIGKVGKQTFLEGIISSFPTLGAGQSAFHIHFEWDSDMGIPGAFYIKNYMQVEFFLVSLTLEDIPNQGTLHFVCNSWVYNSKVYEKDRIFFANKTYLPSETPGPLVMYREVELQTLRGNGEGKRKEWDRIYDYDVYNDLGNPDSSEKLARPVIGGSITHPYPRRGRTGRKPTKKDPNCEKPGNVYVPRDENFGHLKSAEFLSYGIKSLSRNILPALKSVFELNFTPDPLPALKEFFRTDGENVLKFSVPDIIKVSKSAWMTDEEFAREMLAGVNPCIICRLQKFPPQSKLDIAVYGDQTSKVTKEHIEINLEGLTVDEAISGKRLFILDHHDIFMRYLRRINESSAKVYATRTILFLKNDGTLKPLTIELSLPHPDGDKFGAISKVILPADQGVESTIWLLAKAYVIVNDSCYHQLISHWLNTHAVIEPFVISTNRHLSCAMEISSTIYKNWVFPDQALPADLIKRGMAIEDPSSQHGLRLVIEDYPYAVDGLEIWNAIKTWVQDYVSLYYATDEVVKTDSELQAWWKEVVEKGHAFHAAVNFGQYPYGGFILNRPTLSRRLIPEKGTPQYDEMVESPQKAYLRTITPKHQTLLDLSVIEILSRHASDEVYLGNRENPNWTYDSRAIEAFKKFGNKLKEIEETSHGGTMIQILEIEMD
ncbi:PLAT/LH2 domain [Sesbania bispinosa]|nr:PLAT/LH2 domain [Sesbania bispinosa]